ncbi:E3 ubiquitin-protein ligase TRIM21-like [Trichomycterus rosablanca]|uniref:E3 ubiquitin-protein ligase TRIM21-like n=1 Tax=Trichomycterus rosablanca TaxID=2290929 RepID=UPI002F3608F1
MIKTLKSCLNFVVSNCNTLMMAYKPSGKLSDGKLSDDVENFEIHFHQKHGNTMERFCGKEDKNHSDVSTKNERRVNKIYSSLRSSPTKDWTKTSIKSDESVKTLKTSLVHLLESCDEEIKRFTTYDLKRIQQYAVDITLDPDTANSKLILSDDGKQVRHGDKRQNFPDSQERFISCPCVLGKQGFSSGRFYYEVQVCRKTDWALGVTRVSTNKKGKVIISPKFGYWIVWLKNKTEYEACDSPPVLLTLKQAPQKVGVFVDYEQGLVSFYDVDARSHIYSFTDQFFKGGLYPYFCPSVNYRGTNLAPLIITPVEDSFFTAVIKSRYSSELLVTTVDHSGLYT